MHSWTEQYSHRPPEGKDTYASAAVNLSYFSHSSQVTHSAPEITTRKENKNPPLASLLNVPFICGRLIHHYRIRALSYSRASLHFPPPESAPRLDLKEGNYGICCCLTNWFPAASICPDLSPRGSEVRACFWGCYYRAAPGLFGLICPELRADWRSRRDAEDAAWSLSNRSRCWSTKVTDSMHQWPLNWLGPQLHLLFNVRFEGAQTTMMWSITAVTLPGPPAAHHRGAAHSQWPTYQLRSWNPTVRATTPSTLYLNLYQCIRRRRRSSMFQSLSWTKAQWIQRQYKKRYFFLSFYKSTGGKCMQESNWEFKSFNCAHVAGFNISFKYITLWMKGLYVVLFMVD